MRENNEITSLTGLRFIAAAYVFMFHINMRWTLSANEFTNNILSQGAVGMSVFFMLSGFLLSYRYEHVESNSSSYLVNRFARIYPIYLVAMLTTLPWLGINLQSGGLENSQNITKFVLLLISNVFLIQAWFPQLFSYWNDGGSWSISVEAFLYISLPILLPAISRLKTRSLLLLIIALYCLSSLPGLLLMFFPEMAMPFPVFYATPIYRLPEFLIGVCMLLLYKRRTEVKSYTYIQILVVLGFIIYLGVLGQKMPSYIGHNFITVPVISFMLFSLANDKGVFAKVLGSNVLVWLGKISYCFYSFQVMVLLFLANNHDSLTKTFPFLLNNKLLGLGTFLFLILLSAAGYYFIEEPARRKITTIYRKHKDGNKLPQMQSYRRI